MKTKNKLPRKRGRPSLSDGEAVLQNLYHIAYTHFFLNGMEGANLQLIAKEAGVSRQMIHKRFGSKEQFFDTVFKDGQNYLRRKFIYQGTSEDQDPWTFLNDLGLQVYEAFVDPGSVASFRMLDLAVFRHSDVARLHTKSLNEAYKRFGKMLRQMATARGLDIDIGKSEVRDFLSLIRGYSQPVIQGREKPPSKAKAKREINAMVTRYLRGLGFGEPPA
jgi:AcrR family transcriptional regulator